MLILFMSTGPSEINFFEIPTQIHTFSLRKMHLKMFAKVWPFSKFKLILNTPFDMLNQNFPTAAVHYLCKVQNGSNLAHAIYRTQHSQIPLWHGPIYHITYGIAVIEAVHKSEVKLTIDTPHVWVFYCEDLRENWWRYNGIALYYLLILRHRSATVMSTRICPLEPTPCASWMRRDTLISAR